MSKLKEQILELRSKGLTYLQVSDQLQCSKGTVCYYCGINQKEKMYERQKKRFKLAHPYVKKIFNFFRDKNNDTKKVTAGSINKRTYEKIREFFRNKKESQLMKSTFDVNDVINKLGENPTCYLTGDPIDINKPNTYEFDHIIPRSRGGHSDIDNLGICTKQANRSKVTMTPDEYINLCKKVLEHNGYNVSKKAG